ncbi:hypothetical protein PV703_31895 [Streptomyces sp. ME01-24h]|nr:hypothetical protein [Streptomyces sp. ME01-24h]
MATEVQRTLQEPIVMLTGWADRDADRVGANARQAVVDLRESAAAGSIG